jgi:hypothetical protein
VDDRETAGVGKALGLGMAQVGSLPPVTLGMFGARLLGAWAVAVLLSAFLRGPSSGWPWTWALGGLLSVSVLVSAVVRNTLLAAALVQGRARMLGEPVPAFGVALESGFSRGLGYQVVGGAAQLLAGAWSQVSLIAAGWGWVLFLGEGRGVFAPSAALTAALLGGLAVTWGTGVWVDLGLARATAQGTPFSVGVFQSAPGLGARWGSAVLVILTCNMLGTLLETMVAVPLGLISGGFSAGAGWNSTVLGQLGSGFATALAWSLWDHVRAQSLLALQLEFPAPPPVASVLPPLPPSVIPVAEVVHPVDVPAAEVVRSGEPGGTGGPP